MISAAERLDASWLRDDALAESARLGNATAFAELTTRHRDAIYIIARNLCRTDHETEEILEKALLTAWRALASFPPGARFTTWLYRIVTRTALSHPGRARPAHVECRSSQPMDVAGVLRDVLECIDDRRRAAFVLCDLLELLPEETAVILDTSPREVRRDVHDARLLLRDLVERMSSPFRQASR
jgi:RNA polymerase sigma-70 factor (ECF subfamily)